MAHSKTVTRQYSIKRILSHLKQWEASKLQEELQEAWGYSYDHTNKLINSIEGKPPYLSAEKIKQAADVLGVTMETIMTPFEDEARASIKI